jgi:hypothetical protein
VGDDAIEVGVRASGCAAIGFCASTSSLVAVCGGVGAAWSRLVLLLSPAEVVVEEEAIGARWIGMQPESRS